MVEFIDNAIQFMVTLLSGIGAVAMYYRKRTQAYFLLTCFYGTFSLGTLYWTLNVLLFNHTPQVFYVSELSWLASYMFLLTLEYSLSTSDERAFRHPAVWIVPVFCVPQLVLYVTHGDLVINLLMCGMTMAAAWFSVRGLFYARRQTGKPRDMQCFHIAVLCVIVLEYGIWTASCFWVGDTLKNPYFWFDFMMTASLFALLPATRKAVEA